MLYMLYSKCYNRHRPNIASCSRLARAAILPFVVKKGWLAKDPVCTTRIAPVFLGFDVILTLFYHAASTWTSPQCNAMILIHKLAFP